MARKFDYKLIVIGSGAAGTASALGAAAHLKPSSVALIEGGVWGGSAYSLRDVPFAAASHFANSFTAARAAASMGVSSTNLRYNYPSMATWRDHTIRNLNNSNRKNFTDAGIDCFRGSARFLNPYEILVGESKHLTAPRFILATGSRIDFSEIAGASPQNCFTADNILHVNRPPRALLIVGGGATGCEMAQYFTEIGAKVILCEQKDRLLPTEDPEVSDFITNFFTKKLGIKVLTSSKVTAVEQDRAIRRVIFSQNDQQKSVRVDAVLLATTAYPVTDYGLENARVQYKKSGIITDRGLQTSSKHIWAAGDALGGESSLRKAAYEGQLAVANSVRGAKALLNYSGLMRITATNPAIIKIGLNEIEAKYQHLRGIHIATFPIANSPAAKLTGANLGFIKLLADRSHHLVGATVVSPAAELIAHELSLAIRYELPLATLESTPTAPFSWSETLQLAIKQFSASNQKI